MRTVIFKTSKSTLPGVILHSKHALHVVPNLACGDLILIAQTLNGLEPRQKQIRYRMTFFRSYPDVYGESDKIWSHHWKYIIEGTNLSLLQHPFNIRDVQVTDTNYAQGGSIVYVDQQDEELLRKEGYLEPVQT